MLLVLCSGNVTYCELNPGIDGPLFPTASFDCSHAQTTRWLLLLFQYSRTDAVDELILERVEESLDNVDAICGKATSYRIAQSPAIRFLHGMFRMRIVSCGQSAASCFGPHPFQLHETLASQPYAQVPKLHKSHQSSIHASRCCPRSLSEYSFSKNVTLYY